MVTESRPSRVARSVNFFKISPSLFCFLSPSQVNFLASAIHCTWGNLVTGASCAVARGTTIRTTHARPTATTTIQTTVTTMSVCGWWCVVPHLKSFPFHRFPDSSAPFWTFAGLETERVPYHRHTASSLCPPTTVCGTRTGKILRWRRCLLFFSRGSFTCV